MIAAQRLRTIFDVSHTSMPDLLSTFALPMSSLVYLVAIHATCSTRPDPEVPPRTFSLVTIRYNSLSQPSSSLSTTTQAAIPNSLITAHSNEADSLWNGI